jgi:hypothetical protein
METTPQIILLQQELLTAYQNLFENQGCLNDIRLILEALRNNSPFLQHCLSADGTYLVPMSGQPNIGSGFSSIFLPFHIGREYPLNVRQILSGTTGTESLITFMERCAKLEKLTEQFAYIKNESDIQNKEEIVSELQAFVDEFPSSDTFREWISCLDKKSV